MLDLLLNHIHRFRCCSYGIFYVNSNNKTTYLWAEMNRDAMIERSEEALFFHNYKFMESPDLKYKANWKVTTGQFMTVGFLRSRTQMQEYWTENMNHP